MIHLVKARHRFRLIAAAKLLVAALLLGGASAPTLAQPHGFGPSGMGEMGGQMGEHGGGQQQLYPSLMTAPPAGPAALREAHRRMTSGLPLLREGLDEARRALQAGDAQAMREAADRLSEGLNLYRSGLSTHLALSAGHTPAQAALGWYRGQLGLPVATVMPMATDGGGVL
jgi:glycine betaine catabolism B